MYIRIIKKIKGFKDYQIIFLYIADNPKFLKNFNFMWPKGENLKYRLLIVSSWPNKSIIYTKHDIISEKLPCAFLGSTVFIYLLSPFKLYLVLIPGLYFPSKLLI